MRVKNNKITSDTWVGQEIAASAYYTLEASEIFRWQVNDKVLTDIGSGDLIVNDGTNDILEVGSAINYLLGTNTDPKDADGNLISAPTFGTGLGLNAVWKGYKYQATQNATNFFDEEITTQLKVLGGWYEIIVVNGGNNKPVLGDYLEFSIVDKNDVLGLFAYFGLTVGVDVLELGKFLRTEMINPEGGNKREMFYVNTPQSVITGLFFRTRYEATGPTYPVDFKIVLHYYEV